MLGEDIGLDIDAVAGLDQAQGGHGEGVGDEHDGEPLGLNVDQGEADAVDGDRSLGDEEWGPTRVEVEGEEVPLPFRAALAERGGRVDVALDEVAAQAVADPQRPFEVDAVP